MAREVHRPMPFYATTDHGLVRRRKNTGELLDVPVTDLGQALEAGLTAHELAEAPARSEVDVARLRVRPPVLRPRVIWIVGANYRAHAADAGMAGAVFPPAALKSSSSVNGPYDRIVLPRLAPDHVDYEGELAVVIGRHGKDIDVAAGWDHVFGLTGAQDISARDVQFGRFVGGARDPVKAKSFDSFTPIGPWVVTPEEFPDPEDIPIRTLVDEEIRQDARTSEMIFPVGKIISFLSMFATLHPGDVILTGTPDGVGYPAGRFLRPGQTVRTELGTIGRLENRIVSEGL